MSNGLTFTPAQLAALGKTVVDGRVVDLVDTQAAKALARTEFPDAYGCWCIAGVWTRAKQLGIDTEPRESGNQQQIRELFTSKGCRVLCLSQYRPSAVAKGVPDLYIFGPTEPRPSTRYVPYAFWWESKRPRGGVMSDEQIQFALDCARTNTLYGCGPASAAFQFATFLGLA